MCNSHTFHVFNATYAAFFPQPLAEKVRVRQKGPHWQRNTSRAGTSLYCAILAENLFFTKTVIVYSTVRPHLQKSIPLIKAKGMNPLGQTFKAKETIGLCIKQKNGSIGVTCPYKISFFQPKIIDTQLRGHDRLIALRLHQFPGCKFIIFQCAPIQLEEDGIANRNFSNVIEYRNFF